MLKHYMEYKNKFKPIILILLYRVSVDPFYKKTPNFSYRRRFLITRTQKREVWRFSTLTRYSNMEVVIIVSNKQEADKM